MRSETEARSSLSAQLLLPLQPAPSQRIQQARAPRLAAEGLRNREIAEALVVSRKTVDYHLHHVYQKLGVGREKLAETLAAAAKT